MTEKGMVRAGTAGWVYAPWRGSFYPPGLPQKQELAYASARLGAIEINATFRAFQNPASFARWREEAAEGFVFCVKGHQFITHIRRLKEVETPLADFFASGLFNLGEKLGPICWQLPDTLPFDAERIARFLALLPKDKEAAEALARRHGDRLKHPPVVEAKGVGKVRHALEVRHESYRDPAFIDLMRQHNVALVVSDTADWPARDLTADFGYLRLQGPPGGDHYDAAGLDDWAATIAAWADGKPAPAEGLIAPAAEPVPRDVFCFFVRTDKEHAPMNAITLTERLATLRAMP